MKTYKYKIVSLILLLTVSVQAQKFDKKINENFKVNSDVTIVINAAQTDVDIETWNRNEVSIEAVMEVEGISKKEADKILGKWKFEALGNKSKVKITSLSDNFDFEYDRDFDFNFDFPEIEIPYFELPVIDFPEFKIPEMPQMPEMEFDYEAYKKDSSYLKGYKIQVAKQVEKFKNSGWKMKFDSVRNSEEFKHSVEEAKRAVEEVRKQMLENNVEFKEQMKAAEEAGKMAKELIKKMKEEGKFDSIRNRSENIYFKFSDNKNSKVKIKKYLKIKVPKNATFDLNVRQGKLNIPNSSTKMSANISYGNFIGGIITGSKNELIFSNSPVQIDNLNSGNITLKNVPNATFGTFSNANLFSNSSNVLINEVGIDTSLSQKFGSIKINGIVPNFKAFNLILDSAKANLKFANANFVYQINSKKSTLELSDKLKEVKSKTVDGVNLLEGFYNNKSSQNKLFLTGVYSTINLN